MHDLRTAVSEICGRHACTQVGQGAVWGANLNPQAKGQRESVCRRRAIVENTVSRGEKMAVCVCDQAFVCSRCLALLAGSKKKKKACWLRFCGFGPFGPPSSSKLS
jgi:hypothetical protein